jgi:hypothetical protein
LSFYEEVGVEVLKIGESESEALKIEESESEVLKIEEWESELLRTDSKALVSWHIQRNVCATQIHKYYINITN